MGQVQRDYAAWCESSALTTMARQEFLRELRREGHGRGWSIPGGVMHQVALQQTKGTVTVEERAQISAGK